MRVELFLGQAGSGKSAFAEARMLTLCPYPKPLYLATLPRNRAFQPRILKHRASRRDFWQVLEIARSLSEVQAVPETWLSGGILLDGLVGLVARRLQAAWVLKQSLEEEGRELAREYETFLAWSLPRAPHLFIVSNIVGESVRPLPVDKEIVETNTALCSLTADRAATVWLASQGKVRRINASAVPRLRCKE